MRLNLASLQQAGATVEVWDCAVALGNGSDAGRNALVDPGVEVRRFTQVDDAVRALTAESGDESFFVCLIGWHKAAVPLFRALGRAKARYALLLVDVQPFGNTALRSQRSGGTSRLLAAIRRGGRPFRDFTLRLLGVWPPELIIAGGERSLATSETDVVNRDTRVLWAHAVDYDRFLTLPLASRRKTGAVFLDQFLEGHPDQLRAGGPFCDPSTYYANLIRVFEAIESSLGEPLVIAAHPRADYHNRDARFGGREIVWGRTAELVAGSKWVVAHDSTAVAYAVLFGVPVTFITDEGIRRSQIRRAAVEKMAHLLRRRLHNLDADPLPSWEAESRIDPRAYHAYRTAFLKRDGSPERPLWTIVMSYLRGEIPTERFGSCNTVPTPRSNFLERPDL